MRRRLSAEVNAGERTGTGAAQARPRDEAAGRLDKAGLATHEESATCPKSVNLGAQLDGLDGLVQAEGCKRVGWWGCSGTGGFE